MKGPLSNLPEWLYSLKVTTNWLHTVQDIIRVCIQKFPDGVNNEIHAYNNKRSLRSNTTGYGGKTHENDS
jgi:hypothetical protein